MIRMMMNQESRKGTQISPMLAVRDGKAAIEFYKRAFGAEELWRIDNNGQVVAGLMVNGAKLFLANESPNYGTRVPDLVGHTTVRIELFVDDPYEAHDKAIAAGAIERSPVEEHKYDMTGSQPIKRMLQGFVVDPFGHMWLIGKISDE
jgi:PhnB protein